MIKEYSFYDGAKKNRLEFDDSKSVRELIEYAFEVFGYYEPLGMDIVTIFQHSRTTDGWFTTDTSLTCAQEIEYSDGLNFAYHVPGVFYFAEGGWGHHMPTLGNHPEIPNAVSIIISTEDLNDTIVINGDYSFEDIVKTLKETEYIDQNRDYLEVLVVGPGEYYHIPLSDPIMKIPLIDFIHRIGLISERIELESNEQVFYEVFRLGGERLRFLPSRDWYNQ